MFRAWPFGSWGKSNKSSLKIDPLWKHEELAFLVSLFDPQYEGPLGQIFIAIKIEDLCRAELWMKDVHRLTGVLYSEGYISCSYVRQSTWTDDFALYAQDITLTDKGRQVLKDILVQNNRIPADAPFLPNSGNVRRLYFPNSIN